MTHLNEKKIHLIFFTFFLISNSYSQTILNTENILRDIDSTFAIKFNTESDLNFGNIELLQINNSFSLGKKIKNTLIRLSFSHEYISEEKEVISNDWSGQIRINHFFKKNSIFIFLQTQNIVSMELKNRHLKGGGYRKRILEKKKNYFDFSTGIFDEKETYNQSTKDLTLRNLRIGINSFSNFLISKKIELSTSVYYQINSKNSKDYRLFIEPRVYFGFDKFNLYYNFSYRYHSTPYINIKKNDNKFIFGIELDI